MNGKLVADYKCAKVEFYIFTYIEVNFFLYIMILNSFLYIYLYIYTWCSVCGYLIYELLCI